MRALFPGRFMEFSAMDAGEIFIFRDDADKVQLAMKVHYPDGKRDHVVRFFPKDSSQSARVVLNLRTNLTAGHTLLAFNDVEIAPIDRTDFVGLPELDGQAPKGGWLGLAGETPFLTVKVDDPGSVKLGFVDLSSGNLVDGTPRGTCWFRTWSMTLPEVEDAETLYEMKS